MYRDKFKNNLIRIILTQFYALREGMVSNYDNNITYKKYRYNRRYNSRF